MSNGKFSGFLVPSVGVLMGLGTLSLLLCGDLEPARAAPHLHKEKFYQAKWCGRAGGRTEVVQRDRTRVDCLTDTHAIEFDFGPKWAESIGQSLYYAVQTGKKPGVVLILEKNRDIIYWIRLNTVIDEFGLNIKTWKLMPEDR